MPRTPSTPRITTFPPVPITCDAVRTKCREMLTAALQSDSESAGSALGRQPHPLSTTQTWVGQSLSSGCGYLLQVTTWPRGQTASTCQHRLKSISFCTPGFWQLGQPGHPKVPSSSCPELLV